MCSDGGQMAPPPVDTSRGRQRLQRNVQSFIVSSVCIFVRVALSRDPRKRKFVISGSAKEGDSIGVSLGCNQGSKTAWRRHDCKKKIAKRNDPHFVSLDLPMAEAKGRLGEWKRLGRDTAGWQRKPRRAAAPLRPGRIGHAPGYRPKQ